MKENNSKETAAAVCEIDLNGYGHTEFCEICDANYDGPGDDYYFGLAEQVWRDNQAEREAIADAYRIKSRV